MAIPTRTKSSIAALKRFTPSFVFDPNDSTPVFWIQETGGVAEGVCINLSAFLDAGGKLSQSNMLIGSVAAAFITPAMNQGGATQVALLAGVDETAGNVTVTGMTAADEINGVIVLTTAASIATAAVRAAGDFVPGSGAMVSTANKANNTGNQYLIVWTKKH